MIKTYILEITKMVFCIIALCVICSVFLIFGCTTESDFMDSNKDSFDVRSYIGEVYPHLDLIQVVPNSVDFHVKGLSEATEVNVAAYHIIALGLIGEDRPDVRIALKNVARRFKSHGVPPKYDWPENAKKFRDYLGGHSDYVVDHYPGNRNIPMLVLVDEAFDKITKKPQNHENDNTSRQKGF